MITHSSMSVGWYTSATSTISGVVMWNGLPVINDDDGGTAGVREPRGPRPTPMPPATAAVALTVA